MKSRGSEIAQEFEPAFDVQARVDSSVVARTIAQNGRGEAIRLVFFLNRFKKLGFVQFDDEVPVKVNSSLLTVVLHD